MFFKREKSENLYMCVGSWHIIFQNFAALSWHVANRLGITCMIDRTYNFEAAFPGLVSFLPPTNEVAGRYCFYSCLSAHMGEGWGGIEGVSAWRVQYGGDVCHPRYGQVAGGTHPTGMHTCQDTMDMPRVVISRTQTNPEISELLKNGVTYSKKIIYFWSSFVVQVTGIIILPFTDISVHVEVNCINTARAIDQYLLPNKDGFNATAGSITKIG